MQDVGERAGWSDPRYGVTILCGDSRVILDRLYEAMEVVDMVLTDPPYGISYQGLVHAKLANDDAPPVWCIPQMARLMKPNTPMYVCTREDVSEWWRQAMRDAGLNVKTSIIWDKQSMSTGDTLAEQARATEMMLIAHKGRALLKPFTWGDLPRWPLPRTINDREHVVRRDTCLWSYPLPRDAHSRLHPTPKPPELMERAMVQHSHPGDTILDPFCGGGSVGVAAIRQRRRYIGIELEEKYWQLAVENAQRTIAEIEDPMS